MNHFLITRFNIATRRQTDKNDNPTNTETWLERRFELFEKYCFSSVKHQSDQNFKWICLFGDHTSEKYRVVVENYKKEMDNFVPCYLSVEEAMDMRGYLRGVIRQHLTEDAVMVITSRVDNDDALHRDYMKLTKIYAENKDCMGHILSFYYGYQYMLNLNLLVKERTINNHFLTFVEPVDSFGTVMTFNHSYVGKFAVIDQLGDDKRPYWIEVVHESNLINQMSLSFSRRRPRLRTISLAEDYGIDETVPAYKAVIGYLTSFVPRYMARKAKKIFKNKS